MHAAIKTARDKDKQVEMSDGLREGKRLHIQRGNASLDNPPDILVAVKLNNKESMQVIEKLVSDTTELRLYKVNIVAAYLLAVLACVQQLAKTIGSLKHDN